MVPTNNSTDIDTIQEITFEEVYKDCSAKILNLAFRFTSDEELARDLTQEVFIKVYENLNTFKGQSSSFTWVYRIAVNHILNYLKKEKRQRLFSIMDKNVRDALQEELKKENNFGNSASPAQILEDREREKIVKKIIEDLPPKYKLPFILFKYEEMSYKEIAESMEISLSAVTTRIHRARKQLIKELGPWLKHL